MKNNSLSQDHKTAVRINVKFIHKTTQPFKLKLTTIKIITAFPSPSAKLQYEFQRVKLWPEFL